VAAVVGAMLAEETTVVPVVALTGQGMGAEARGTVRRGKVLVVGPTEGLPKTAAVAVVRVLLE